MDSSGIGQGKAQKVLVRNNIEQSGIKKGKGWSDVPLFDKVFSNGQISVFGSKVFHSIWKAWSQVRSFIPNRGASGGLPTYSVLDRSIWWGVETNGKPLALTQSSFGKKMA